MTHQGQNPDPLDEPSFADRPELSVVPLPSAPVVIGAPRISAAHLSRPRLNVLLDDPSSPALRIVRAGTGFGKTSLIADWIRNREAGSSPAIWVTIDDGVSTRLYFWEAVLGLLDLAGLVETSEFRLVEARTDVSAALRPALLRGFESLPEPVTLVIDGFERFADDRIESDLIDLLMRTTKLNVVVATHVHSAITSLTTAARVDTVMIDAPALRFDPDEVELLAQRMGVDASRPELDELCDAVDGWPFGVRAVLERRRRADAGALSDSHIAVFGVPRSERDPLDLDFAHRYLLSSLDGLDGLDLLAITSIVDAFTLDQAAFLGADLHGHPLIPELESRGLGTWENDVHPPLFRLHPVFKEALRRRFDSGSEDTIVAVNRRLAQWFADREDYVRAFRAAVDARDWELASSQTRQRLFWIFFSQMPNTIERVPDVVIRRDPLLLLISGHRYYARGQYGKAVQTLLAAIGLCERQRLAHSGTVTPEQVWVQGVLTLSLRLIGRYELLPAALRRFTKMLDTVHDPEGTLGSSLSLFHVQSALTYLFLDKTDSAWQIAANASLRSLQDLPPMQRISWLGVVSLVHARREDIAQTRRALRAIDEESKPKQFNQSFYAVPHHLAAARVEIERFDADAAAEHLARTDIHWSTMEYWPLALELRTLVDWQRLGPHAALTTLREGRAEKRSHPPIGSPMNAVLSALEAELLLASDLGSEASSLLAPSKIRRSSRLTVPKARSLLQAGRFEQAASLADRNVQRRSLPWAQRMHLFLISASANLRSGDGAAARERFDRAVEIARRAHLQLPFAAMPHDDLQTLAEAMPELVERILARPQLFPPPGDRVMLSRREQLVLAELANDATLATIAKRLSVSANTLKSQLRAIYRKLGVSGRDEAVAVARRRGLLHPGHEDE